METMKIKPKSLKKNFFYNFVNQVLVLIVPLITAPYLARVLLETGNGQFSFANSIITYFILFANLGFTIYGQREIAKTRDNEVIKSKVFWEIIILRFFTTILSSSTLLIVLLTVGFGEKYDYLIWVLGIQVVGTAIDINFYYQGIEDFRGIAFRSIFIKVIGLICIFVFVKEQSDLWKYALSISLINVGSNIIMWPKVIKEIKIRNIGKLELKKHLIPAIMIFLPTLAITIYSVLDKTMIGILSTNPDYDNGCYEQAYKINSIALILITVIAPIMIPRNTYDFKNNNIDSLREHLYFSSSYVWLIGLPLMAGFGVLSWNLSSWFLGEGYLDVPIMMVIMSVRFVASGLGVTFGDQLFIAIGKEKYCTIATSISALINFGLNFIFIPWLGGIGAAITTAIAEISVTSILAIYVWKSKILSIRHVLRLSLKNVLAALVMFFVIFFIQKYLPFAIWSFMLITVIGAIIYFVMLIILRDQFFINLMKTGFSIVRNKINRNRIKS